MLNGKTAALKEKWKCKLQIPPRSIDQVIDYLENNVPCIDFRKIGFEEDAARKRMLDAMAKDLSYAFWHTHKDTLHAGAEPEEYEHIFYAVRQNVGTPGDLSSSGKPVGEHLEYIHIEKKTGYIDSNNQKLQRDLNLYKGISSYDYENDTNQLLFLLALLEEV